MTVKWKLVLKIENKNWLFETSKLKITFLLDKISVDKKNSKINILLTNSMIY